MGDHSPEFQAKRRSLLQFFGVGAAAGISSAVQSTATGHMINTVRREADIMEHGRFDTPLATWVPISEIHGDEDALAPNRIPENLNALSIETRVDTLELSNGMSGIKEIGSLYAMDPSDLFSSYSAGQDVPTIFDQKIVRAFPDTTLDHLKKQSIPVAFGDFAYLRNFKDWWNEKDMNAARASVGVILGAVGLGTTSAVSALPISFDRRQFLQTAGIAGLGAGVALAGPPLAYHELHTQIMNFSDQEKIHRRTVALLKALNSKLRPEYLNDFFREAIQANKLMTMASVMKEETSKKPKIGFNWHVGHEAGIEDWLLLGPDITRACIEAYPDTTLKQVVQANLGDHRSLTTMRLVEVPKSFQVKEEGDKATGTFDRNDDFIDREYTDTALVENLQNRGIV